MANPNIKTWTHLYERLGRQQLDKYKDQRIIYKDDNGNIIPVKLAYNETGSLWWFEKLDKNNNVL